MHNDLDDGGLDDAIQLGIGEEGVLPRVEPHLTWEGIGNEPSLGGDKSGMVLEREGAY